VTAAFAVKLFPSEASLLSVCLASLLTVESVGRLGATRSERPVRFLALRLGALFAGCALGYALLALFLPPPDLQAAFARQLAHAGGPGTGFGDFGPLLRANLYVLAFFFLVGCGFRMGGVMIAVAWNASVWGATFGSRASSLVDLGFWLAVAGPHMALEAVAYVVSGLAGVLVGRGVLRAVLTEWSGWGPLGRTAGVMLLVALASLAVAAAWEAWIADWMLAAWR
jgi:hypothetical protein